MNRDRSLFDLGSRAADPRGVGRGVEQSRTELCALHALIADFVVRKLLVLGCRRVAEVRRRVRKHRLLAEQHEQGEQQVHQSTAGVHGTCNIR